MAVTIDSIQFDSHEYHDRGDVLYLSFGEPRVPAETDATPEGHAVDFDAAGNVIRHRLNHRSFAAGTWTVRWHGKNDKFHRVHSGRYTAVVVAFDSHGNHVRKTTEIDVV